MARMEVFDAQKSYEDPNHFVMFDMCTRRNETSNLSAVSFEQLGLAWSIWSEPDWKVSGLVHSQIL
ncbi:predicted protein [Sclerotinia sclerotiorum 1980 UF-70]|uniref:Uncharacterized protein n=1 Tax=Sclerotinia sclerotiorum (strain ATCC 18683 / 1980 / Ss-1) TaxID=665079 RepID=A7E3Z3_SCLS1|nr:predicted protein [Sclerotinia sclerotiorum 1980 UF-70]EDN90615.1 predicted protein [Sclerotinia sclerotiorum 1980 UF-70]